VLNGNQPEIVSKKCKKMKYFVGRQWVVDITGDYG
jgi:hypothetical protein